MMSRRLEHPLRLGVILSLVLLLGAAACSDGDGNVPISETETSDDEMSTPHITLTEWTVAGEGGAALPAVPAGEVVFEVNNDGTTFHELAVIASDRDVSDLPVSGGIVDEDAAGELLGRTPQIDPGDIELLTLDLAPGTYALICNIVGHYEQGMLAELVVE